MKLKLTGTINVLGLATALADREMIMMNNDIPESNALYKVMRQELLDRFIEMIINNVLISPKP